MCATGSGRTANTFEVIIVCVCLEGVLDYTIPEPRANRSGGRAAFHRVAGLSRSPLFLRRITAWNSALTCFPGYITSTQGICCNCIINVVMERRRSSLYLLQVYLKPIQKTFETVRQSVEERHFQNEFEINSGLTQLTWVFGVLLSL